MTYTPLTKDSSIMHESGAPHVTLTCENHPHLTWSTKNIAITFDADGKGRYNHHRNIFFISDYPAKECDCPASKLIAIEQ